MDKVRFTPVRGKDEDLRAMPYADGYIYFATDTKKIYLDADGRSKILMSGGGGSNSGIFYGHRELHAGEPDSEILSFTNEDLDGDEMPAVDDLIFNIADSTFYRVTEIVSDDEVRGTKLAVAGGGGGPSSLATPITFRLSTAGSQYLINKKPAIMTIVGQSAKNSAGAYIDESITITWSLAYTTDGQYYTTYKTERLENVLNDVPYEFDFGSQARENATNRLTLTATQLNDNSTYSRTWDFTTSDLSLTSTTDNSKVFSTSTTTIECIATGRLDRYLEYYWDDELIYSHVKPREDTNNNERVSVSSYTTVTPGYHKVKIILSQWVNNDKGISVDPVEFEMAVRPDNPTGAEPIIWLGNYQSQYYNYDDIQIPYNVWSPTSPIVVKLLKDNKELSERILTNTSKFSLFEITNADAESMNFYSITCGDTRRDITFQLVPDVTRADFKIKDTDDLRILFDAKGRSNDESPTKRSSWSYGDIHAKFENFNWYNNGWMTDLNEGKTFLRISNGAKFSVPLGNTIFADPTSANQQSNTFEFQFKIRNVQDYSNLIKNITRYKNDNVMFNQFYDSNTNTYLTPFTNYDAFLADKSKNGQLVINGNIVEYDDLEFDYVAKQINLHNVACQYASISNQTAIGICLGPQDAFFSNGVNTVNVSYVEDQIINITVTYDHSSKLMFIFINGVLTGVIKSTVSSYFMIGSNDTPAELIFNSQYCDIDLYKFRAYNSALNINDIIVNYAVDTKDIKMYDQSRLATYNQTCNEFFLQFDKVTQYNLDHPQSPIMPYIIFDTTHANNGNKLSYSKAVKVDIGVEFVNTPLELAYTSGELESLAKDAGLFNTNSTQEEKDEAIKYYYQHHCPSFVGDHVQMAVQGTSSEFYPRRNYKLKTKTGFALEVDEEATQEANEYNNVEGHHKLDTPVYKNKIGIMLNKGPFAADYIADPESTRQKYWYMDNDTFGTTKFTMKIDFMESSGSYNMGFANLVKNAYSKHPLTDYNGAGAFLIDGYQAAVSYVEDTTYYYKDSKGKYKNNIAVTSAEDFAAGPVAMAAAAAISGVTDDTWYTLVKIPYQIPNANSYRTSVQGFRVLAFHKRGENDYVYIGMYNMLLDKGSDEAYGFKVDKTTGNTVYQKFAKNKKVPKIAECWEFENNSRTFCSFRDPLNRKDLSFDVYTMEGGVKVPQLNSVHSAPIVADSFEYRYHANADILDYVYDPVKNADKYTSEDTIAYMDDEDNPTELIFNADNTSLNYEARAKVIFDNYKNWEKAVQWVWSTNTDSVLSQGDYLPVTVGTPNKNYAKNTYYIYDENTNTYLLSGADECDNTVTYYEQKISYVEYPTEVGDDLTGLYTRSGETYYPASGTAQENVVYYEQVITYANARITTSEYWYVPGKFYIQVGTNDYALSTDGYDADTTFTTQYYELRNKNESELIAGNYDRLVRAVVLTGDNPDVFDANETYYLYDGTQQPGHATTIVANPTEEDFNAGNYYLGISKTYGTNTYRYDTKEYRAQKFVNELQDHFDLEYLATYFVMTEVFECYDSRGKNAMFASWGPLRSGGDYIWYPIFYDIDTQLGINNTGIPSFEYNVDATLDGNYSTSDSVLWNNFYKYFKTSAILMKYKHLNGVTEGVTWAALSNPPLSSVENIENWYLTDPDTTGSIAMRGHRPIIATNLDEYYKYITITNPAGTSTGMTGGINNSGNFEADTNGTYFYALQGDRSLSRQQFLSNRLEYIDSWLNQGDYQRGGSNRIAGRIAANNASKTSDKWIESGSDTSASGNTYYLADGTKRHKFDAEYWVNLTPTHSSYVTLGDDNEAYPSRKYDGINPVKFGISSVERGVRSSANYPEQLLYIYGMNQMADVGDMSKLYWQEFRIEGNARHLTKLKLGYDGAVQDIDPADGQLKEMTWYNNRVNQPSIPASSEATGMPLLKEVNFCNMQINTGTPTLDLTSCEKLENFRATGSNYTEVKFAPGVALNTLYLPSSIATLELIEARLLKKLLTTYTRPTENEDGDLVAVPGLYIEGLFNGASSTTNIQVLDIRGGGLGYDSYKLLKQYYDLRKNVTGSVSRINMTDVNWTPYRLVEPGEAYVNGNSYFINNNHYGLTSLGAYNVMTWDTQVANGEIYVLDTTIPAADINQIDGIDMLQDFMRNDSPFANTTTIIGKSVPNITGNIYINNSEPIDEGYIRNVLQPTYPNLTFFFANVDTKYTARFILLEDDDTYQYVNATGEPLSIQTIDPDAEGNVTWKKTWFDDPLTKYTNVLGLKPNYDFYGWAIRDDINGTYSIGDHNYKVVSSADVALWDTQTLDNNVYDYTFYAVFDIHKYVITFVNDSDNTSYIKRIPFGATITAPTPTEYIPHKSDALLATDRTYKHIGWSLLENGGKVDLSTYRSTKDYTFHALFSEIDVHENVLSEDYFDFVLTDIAVPDPIETYTVTGYALSLKQNVQALVGKITLPTTYNNMPIIKIGPAAFNVNELYRTFSSQTSITHVFFENADNCNVIMIGQQEFFNCTGLQYIEFPASLKIIQANAFNATANLYATNEINFSAIDLVSLNNSAFANAFAALNAEDNERRNVYFSGSMMSIGQSSLFLAGTANGVYQFGSATDRLSNFSLSVLSTSTPVVGAMGGRKPTQMIFYMTTLCYENFIANYMLNGETEAEALTTIASLIGLSQDKIIYNVS